MCGVAISRELRYWGIDSRLISECCFKRFKETLREVLIVEELDSAMKTDSVAKDSLSGQIWLTMERPGHSFGSWIWFGIYMTFIAMSIVVVAMSSVRSFRVYRTGQGPVNGTEETLLDNLLNSDLCTTILVFDVMGLVFFTIEPIVRLCVSPNFRRYLTKALNLLDLFLAVDHWTCFIMEWNEGFLIKHESARVAHAILRALLSLRVFRIFHVARRYSKMKVLFLTFRASMAELLLLFLGLFIAVIMYATVIYYVEMLEKANNFLNIPQAIWWAIVTMTTVGYGDFYPTTVSGYFVGVLCALSGLLLLSMPIAIIASNFGTYYNGLVAREQREKRKQYLGQCWKPRRGQADSEDWFLENYVALGDTESAIKLTYSEQGLSKLDHFPGHKNVSEKATLLDNDSCNVNHIGSEGLSNSMITSSGPKSSESIGATIKLISGEPLDTESSTDANLKQRKLTLSPSPFTALIRSSKQSSYNSTDTSDTLTLNDK
ncbi:potassium voltage-gated channel subfamily C member 2-like isoform X2 [Biomphalaria glabrata]|uniref:Potassium voltage-gated channel subfamily C member 2-like isoform X2 n=1 Tax=Biomphalaria glabrata TaxID=6526 RepID=A0A9W2YED8_BIOGL|nr:potassium voltage-gated channel subfamily C member 2-like isoform X2 [Biomphalaria glabrata]